MLVDVLLKSSGCIGHAHIKLAFGGKKRVRRNPVLKTMDPISEEMAVSPISANVSLGSAGKGSEFNKILHDCH